MLSLLYGVVSTSSYQKNATRQLTLVKIGLSVVSLFVLLVDDGILGGSGTGAQLSIVVLGDLLVGLLGGLGTGALDGLGNVVGGVLFRGTVSY